VPPHRRRSKPFNLRVADGRAAADLRDDRAGSARNRSVVATGALFAAETVPHPLLGSAAGVLVDRFHPRRHHC